MDEGVIRERVIRDSDGEPVERLISVVRICSISPWLEEHAIDYRYSGEPQ